MLPFMLRGIPFCDPLCWSLLQHGIHIQIFVVVCLQKFTDNISVFFYQAVISSALGGVYSEWPGGYTVPFKI